MIIPLLLQNAEMPSEQELPSESRTFAGINALKLRDGDWTNDVDKIRKTLAKASFDQIASVPPERNKVESIDSLKYWEIIADRLSKAG